MGSIQNLSISEPRPHPIAQLSVAEAHVARDVILQLHDKSVLDFRTISLEEPLKSELQPFLDAEAAGTITSSITRPARLARVTYDVVAENKVFKYYESLVDVGTAKLIGQELVDSAHHAPLTLFVKSFSCPEIPS
jgi:primary-amine oxidase